MPWTSLVFTSNPAASAARAATWVPSRMPCPPTPTMTTLTTSGVTAFPRCGPDGVRRAHLLAHRAAVAQQVVDPDPLPVELDRRAAELQARLADRADLQVDLPGRSEALAGRERARAAGDDEPRLVRLQGDLQFLGRWLQVPRVDDFDVRDAARPADVLDLRLDGRFAVKSSAGSRVI